MKELKWAVIAECEAKNNGKPEEFDRVIAAFDYPIHAEDFIGKCLPKENRSKFRIERIEAQRGQSSLQRERIND